MSLSVAIKSFPSIEEAHPAFIELQGHNILSKVEKDPKQWCYTLYVAKIDEKRAFDVLADFGFDPIIEEFGSGNEPAEIQTGSSASSDNELDEIRQALKSEKKSLFHKLLVLGISLLIFAWAGLLRGSPNGIFLIILVLLIHESGHWLGMKIFGYKDVQMFFIPGFGAAVSGTESTPCARQKAIVSLMGPIPGIVIGIGCGIAYFLTHIKFLSQAADAFLLINGFNLLPFSPLDGGRFLEAVLFSRHPKAEVVFKALAGLGLAALAFHWKSIGLGIIAYITVISLKQAWSITQTAAILRKELPIDASFANDEIPQEFLKRIVSKLRDRLPIAQRTTKNLASAAKMIWTRMIIRHCSVKACIGLSFLYLVFAIPTLGLFILAQAFAEQFASQNIAPVEKASSPHVAPTNTSVDSSIKWKPINSDKDKYPWGYSKPVSN